MRSTIWSFVAVLAASNTSCNSSLPVEPEKQAEPEKQFDSPFAKDLLKAAAEYESWGRVDDEMHWGPTGCRMPGPTPSPPHPGWTALVAKLLQARSPEQFGAPGSVVEEELAIR